MCGALLGYEWRSWGGPLRWKNRLVLTRFAWQKRAGSLDGGSPLYEVSVSIVFEPRDLWVGIYWTPSGYGKLLIYLCLIPCLPLRFHLKRIYGARGVG